jgi:DNA polymerase III alpha subunit
MFTWNCSAILTARGSAQSRGGRNRAEIAAAAAGDKRRVLRAAERREVLDVFTCLRHHRTLATAGRLLGRNSERHLKSPAEMARFSRIFPKPSPIHSCFPRVCNSRCKIWGISFPKYPVPDGKSQMHFCASARWKE